MGKMVTQHFIYLFSFFVVLFSGVVSADNTPVIIVNLATNTESYLSESALGAIFGMRLRKWEDGSPIKVFVLPDENPLHVAFSKQILRVFPYQLRSAWDRLVFSGTGEEPIKIKTEQQMRSVISSTPGAIGYISRPMIDGTIKVVTFGNSSVE